MLRVAGLNVPLCADADARACALALKKLRLTQQDIASWRVAKHSVDARDRGDVHFVYAVDLTLKQDEAAFLRRLKPGTAALAAPDAPLAPPPAASRAHAPVVVGMGPCGLFAALYLACTGLNPICLERGERVDQRARSVQRFFDGGALDENSNVQFGEGGAGAFSDGKLTTGISDPRCDRVLHTLHECGAPEEILYLGKPHIGTDRLPQVVKTLRERIVRLGGEVRFETRLADLIIEDGHVTGAVLEGADGQRETVDADGVILAVGHSARDTFEALHALGVPMARKPFSIGARIEHKQKLIDRSQYGAAASHPALGAADYKLSVRLPNGRSAYTFCMCPGGYVVAAASEEGGVVTNGMSNCARDGENANAALLVTLTPEDFPDKSTLGGVLYQQQLERAAFEAGGRTYHAPAQLVGDFLAHRPSTAFGSVKPTYRPGVTLCELHDVLPARITSVLEQALPALDKRLHGFAGPDAVLTAPETRSSSPVRIVRGENRQSEIAGLYPCGEGAGYAGGIMSAAVDGILTAEAILNA